jgi:hypothetical protein
VASSSMTPPSAAAAAATTGPSTIIGTMACQRTVQCGCTETGDGECGNSYLGETTA